MPAGVEAVRLEALGGMCELYAVNPAEPLAETADWIRRLHRRLTRFDPSSELSQLNARAGEWFEVSGVLHELLEEALIAYEMSGGLVHAGVLPALVAAGYDRTFEAVVVARSSPVREGRDFEPKQFKVEPKRFKVRRDVHEGPMAPGSQTRCGEDDFEEEQARTKVAGDGRCACWDTRQLAMDRCGFATMHCEVHQTLREPPPCRPPARSGRDHDLSKSAVDQCMSAVIDCIPAQVVQDTSDASALRPSQFPVHLEVRPSSPQTLPLPPLPELLQLRPGAARLAPGAAIDLGGIAKGWIADRAVERIGPNSLANCAGDLMARGPGPAAAPWARSTPDGGRGWPVRFADRTLLLEDMAAATSGTTKRRWGPQSHHLIDPHTGAPSTSDLCEVSVLARSAVDAEALAKTALLLGSDAAAVYLEGRAIGWALRGEADAVWAKDSAA